MKKTNFHALHSGLGAKMVSFAGFEMPIQYPKGIIHEHKCVRNAVGVFDVSHMGEFEVRGSNALDFLQKISINDVSKLEKGKAQYSAMCYPDGGIVDDMLVYHCGDYYMMVVNGACEEKDWAWVMENAQGYSDLQITNVSPEYNLLAVQGPKSLETIAKLTDVAITEIPYYNFAFGECCGEQMILSRTGYTGEIGMELYFKGGEETAKKVWDALFAAGEEFGIEAIGLGARDTLRLEKGYCLYGNDIDNTTNPIEAGLGWITKLQKGDFNGKDVIANVKSEGAKRKLVGITMLTEKLIPRQHYKIMANGQEIGEITSGNTSPLLGKGIGMGYVTSEFSAPGTAVEIAARNTTFPAEVTKVPFL